MARLLLALAACAAALVAGSAAPTRAVQPHDYFTHVLPYDYVALPPSDSAPPIDVAAPPSPPGSSSSTDAPFTPAPSPAPALPPQPCTWTFTVSVNRGKPSPRACLNSTALQQALDAHPGAASVALSLQAGCVVAFVTPLVVRGPGNVSLSCAPPLPSASASPPPPPSAARRAAPACALDGGGASQILRVTGGRLALAGLELRNGRADYGGAAEVLRGGALEAVECTFDRDGAMADGGALFLRNATFAARGVAFSSDSAGGYGGAVSDSDRSAVVAAGTLFRNNSAGSGGAAVGVWRSAYNRCGLGGAGFTAPNWLVAAFLARGQTKPARPQSSSTIPPPPAGASCSTRAGRWLSTAPSWRATSPRTASF